VCSLCCHRVAAAASTGRRWRRCSDIDVDLPAGTVYNGSDVIRASCSSEHSARQELDGRIVWSPALDHALLAVVSIWMEKTRQAQSAATAPQPAVSSSSSSSSSSLPSSSSSPSLSSSSPRPFAASLSSLPSSRSDWSFISCVFLHHSGIRRSASFLQHRFALLLRLMLTTEGEAGEQGRQLRAEDRERLLELLAVRDAALREQALHGGGRNWEREKPITDRRDRRRRGERAETGKRGPEWEAEAAGSSAPTSRQSKRKRGDDEEGERAVVMEEIKQAEPTAAAEQSAAAPAAAAAAVAMSAGPSVSASAPLAAPALTRAESTDPPSSQSSSGSSNSLHFVSAASEDSGDRS
jgi:hypothetical protein